MYLAVESVEPTKNFELILIFSNGEKRQFDVKPYLYLGMFKELSDYAMFCTVHISFDTIQWANEADFDPELLYKKSIVIK